MRRALILLVVAAGAVCSGASGSGSSGLIQASATLQRLGDFRISANPSYAGAIDAFGASSECRLVHGDRSVAVAVWRSIGVRLVLRSYGAIPPGETGCSAPDAIQVHTARATGARWTTSLGLRVGDTTVRLRRRYPSAIASAGVQGWYGRGFWLVTRRAACLGECDGVATVTAPVLVAETAGGRVKAFVFVTGAEGE